MLPRLISLTFVALALSQTAAAAPAEMRAVYAATFDINTQAKCDAIIANVLARNINAVPAAITINVPGDVPATRIVSPLLATKTA